MKLFCDLVINNLQYSGQGLAAKNRAKKAHINVGQNDKNEICIVVQSADNKTGTHYKISGNIDKIFDRFANEGKTTLRLKQPSVELSINNCDALQLRIFLKIIKTGQQSGEDDKKLVETLPQSHKKLKSSDFSQLGRTDLSITTRKELLTATFSHVLVKLEIVGLDLSEMPPSISRLLRLQILNLSGNQLKSLPSAFASPLKELQLTGNLLGHAVFSTWRFFEIPHIRDNLQNLNLNGNQLHHLPLQVCDLKQLTKLELKGNNIRHFPPSFGNLLKLRTLDLSDNKIEAIDASFQSLNLESLDISGNVTDYTAVIIFNPFPSKVVPSLLQAAAMNVINLGLDQSELPVTLKEYLHTFRRCRCLKPVWHTERSVVPLELARITRNMVTDLADRAFPMAFYFCNDPIHCIVRRP